MRLAKKVKHVTTRKEQVEMLRKKMDKKYPDEYRDEIEKKVIKVSDNMKIVFSVRRAGEDGLPYVDIRTYIETDNYTGPTKKGISFPLEMLEDFIETINKVNEECEEKNI